MKWTFAVLEIEKSDQFVRREDKSLIFCFVGYNYYGILLAQILKEVIILQ